MIAPFTIGKWGDRKEIGGGGWEGGGRKQGREGCWTGRGNGKSIL